VTAAARRTTGDDGTGTLASTEPGARWQRPLARVELAVMVGLLLLAAFTRLPGLDARGRWDADQGHDMLVLRALVTDGTLPLLGPPTSIGTFHHGAVYYYLLAPAAAVSGADPVAVTTEIALFGIAAVIATWWLARMIGGPLAGAIAGFLAAVSPAGIDESTFIWNPNLIPFFAAVAFGAAIRGRQTQRAGWWVIAGAGAMAVMQCHVLGIVILVPLAWAWALDLLRRRRDSVPTRPIVVAGAIAAAIIAAGYLPLLAHEIGHDFSETRAILDYVGGGGRAASAGLPTLLALVGLRSVTWPVAGLITDRVVPSLLAAVTVLVLGAVAVAGPVRGGASQSGEGVASGLRVDVQAARWLAGSLGWSVLALAIFAPSLAVVTPGLPNDHYHAFLDPLVLALAAVGIARLWSGVRGATLPGRILAGVALALLAVVAVTAWPPAVAPDGGWRGADEAAARIQQTAAGRSLALDGIPPFKSAAAIGFPLVHRGASPVAASASPGVTVVVCDPLFDGVVGAPCGGPAEDAWLAASPHSGLVLAGRFDAGPRRIVSLYETGAR
jgi:hypothetical protein